ncbi:MAG: metallophosphoesterase [Tenericutes bacterium]|nr:metallophosphoesterase [Mycoplasmatota bacterium]
MVTYYIISDIHSQYDLMMEALKKASFDMENENHILIIAGDILDRGLQGDKTIRFIEQLIIKDRVLGVVGNHDDFLIRILTDKFKIEKILWNIQKNGFRRTLDLGFNNNEKYKVDKASIKRMKENFVKKYPVFASWLINNPIYLIFRNHVIVHGFLDFSLEDWRNTSRHYAVWTRGYNLMIPDKFEKKLVFGHTPNRYINKQNDIIYDGKKIMIDGNAAEGIKINVLKLTKSEI